MSMKDSAEYYWCLFLLALKYSHRNNKEAVKNKRYYYLNYYLSW